MAKKDSGQSKNTPNPYLAGLLAWLVPGAGHWYLGHRSRGGVIFAAVCITFLLGITLSGLEMIDPQNAKAWFCAQLLCGTPTLISLLVQDPTTTINEIYGRGVDLGQVYAGVAGLLNLLCILDVLNRKPQSLPKQNSAVEKG